MNSVMTGEWWSEEGFTGNRQSFTEVLLWHLSGETRK